MQVQHHLSPGGGHPSAVHVFHQGAHKRGQMSTLSSQTSSISRTCDHQNFKYFPLEFTDIEIPNLKNNKLLVYDTFFPLHTSEAGCALTGLNFKLWLFFFSALMWFLITVYHQFVNNPDVDPFYFYIKILCYIRALTYPTLEVFFF